MLNEKHDRWMGFVDGENLLYRGKALSDAQIISLVEGPCYRKDAFLWMPATPPLKRHGGIYPLIAEHAIRVNYYTSMCGDDVAIHDTTQALWALQFNPQVFKKTRQEEKAKGVDVALTKDMLSHAFMGNYDTAVLISGDADYVPLVEEVKRLGKRVHVHFFGESVNKRLRLSADGFHDMTDHFVDAWRNRSGSAHVGLREY